MLIKIFTYLLIYLSMFISYLEYSICIPLKSTRQPPLKTWWFFFWMVSLTLCWKNGGALRLFGVPRLLKKLKKHLSNVQNPCLPYSRNSWSLEGSFDRIHTGFFNPLKVVSYIFSACEVAILFLFHPETSTICICPILVC